MLNRTGSRHICLAERLLQCSTSIECCCFCPLIPARSWCYRDQWRSPMSWFPTRHRKRASSCLFYKPDAMQSLGALLITSLHYAISKRSASKAAPIRCRYTMLKPSSIDEVKANLSSLLYSKLCFQWPKVTRNVKKEWLVKVITWTYLSPLRPGQADDLT